MSVPPPIIIPVIESHELSLEHAPKASEVSYPKGTIVRWYKDDQTTDHLTAVILEKDGRIKDLTNKKIVASLREWMNSIDGGIFYFNERNEADELLKMKLRNEVEQRKNEYRIYSEAYDAERKKMNSERRAAEKEKRAALLLQKKLAQMVEKHANQKIMRERKQALLIGRRQREAAMKITDIAMKARLAFNKKVQKMEMQMNETLRKKTNKIQEKLDKRLEMMRYINSITNKYMEENAEIRKGKLMSLMS